MVNCQRVFCFNQMPEKCTWCHNIPVIDSIYGLIKLFSLFGSLTFIIIYMRQCASEHGKAVRQLSVRQNNTKHAAGTIPLNMYRKELPVGDRVTEEPSSADDIGDQLSKYDSHSSNEEDSATHEEDAVEAVPVNFLSKTVRTRTGRQITLSYRALSSY